MRIPDIDFGEGGRDGHLFSNKVFVKVRNYDIELVAN
jgi:hypothetical protein